MDPAALNLRNPVKDLPFYRQLSTEQNSHLWARRIVQSESHQSQVWKGENERTVCGSVLASSQKALRWIQPRTTRFAYAPNDAIVSCALWNTL